MTAGQADQGEVERFWTVARSHARITAMPGYFGPTTLEVLPPPAWSFGATAEQADELLSLVLDGRKTATASSGRAYEAAGEPLPEIGTLGIVLDGAGHPQALVETIEVSVVRFDEVTEEHALAEGEGDRSLAHWRAAHERFFSVHAGDERGFAHDMPVVLERFRLIHCG